MLKTGIEKFSTSEIKILNKHSNAMYISFRKILWNKWKQLYVSVCFRKDDLD